MNFKIGVTPYTLTTTMLKALVDNSTVWKTTDTDLSTCAKLTGSTFTGAITVNGNTPLYSIPNTAALLSGATFTGAVTTDGLSLGDNSVNFNIGVTPCTLTATELKH